MKTILASLSLGAAALASTANAQNIGDSVSLSALQSQQWVQGEAPKEWEPGKLYVLECWATWCGPCIAAIPHVDALYDKYKEQGLRVIGVDVWEDGQDKVVDFVKKKGEGMSYPVTYTGKGGPFEKEWLKPAGVNGIPHAFLVKDGKVIGMTHPAQLSDALVESILKGGDEEKATLTKLNEAAARGQKSAAAKGAWTTAKKAKDPVAMNAAADQLEAAEPGSFYVPLFRNEALIVAKDWSALETKVESLNSSDKLRKIILVSLGGTLVQTDDVPAQTLSKVTAAYEKMTAEEKKAPTDSLLLTRLYWKANDKEKAAATAREGVEIAKADASKPGAIPAEPFEKFAAAVEGGSVPSQEQFAGWVKEARSAAKEEN